MEHVSSTMSGEGVSEGGVRGDCEVEAANGRGRGCNTHEQNRQCVVSLKDD